MARLILSLDNQVLAEYNMTKERYTIGRLPDNDVRIDNPAVSGHHSLIINILNDSFLEDLNSTNGISVNGQKVQEQLIEAAGEFTFEEWAQLVRQLAEQLDTDGGYDPNENLHANRLRLTPNADATIEITGRLVGEARITVDQTLETLADELFAKFTRDIGVHERSVHIDVGSDRDRDRAVRLGLGAVPAARVVRSEDLVGETDFDMGWRDQAELYRADEVFCTGTMGEVVPVLSLDGGTFGPGQLRVQ